MKNREKYRPSPETRRIIAATAIAQILIKGGNVSLVASPGDGTELLVLKVKETLKKVGYMTTWNGK